MFSFSRCPGNVQIYNQLFLFSPWSWSFWISQVSLRVPRMGKVEAVKSLQVSVLGPLSWCIISLLGAVPLGTMELGVGTTVKGIVLPDFSLEQNFGTWRDSENNSPDPHLKGKEGQEKWSALTQCCPVVTGSELDLRFPDSHSCLFFFFSFYLK